MADEQWPIRIIVLDRGFVLACRCPEPQQYAIWLPYADRRTVRRWGTTNGLGELVNGPLAETVLDALVPVGQVPLRAVLDVMELTEEGQRKWAEVLTGKPAASTARRR